MLYMEHHASLLRSWCPLTNTLLTSAGEISISPWDLYAIGSLPIARTPYEEVVPNVVELTGMYEKDKRYLPKACEHLFDTFHRLREGDSNNPNVPVREWVKFWCRKTSKYEQPLPIKERKSAHFKSSHNPTGAINEDCGRRTSLALPVLASIYRGLNTIPECSKVDLTKLASRPIMCERAARYFGKEDVWKRIHKGDSIAWDSTMINRPDPHHYHDDGTENEFSRQFGYFQDIPDQLDNDFREASLDDRLRLARMCVLNKSRAKEIFPPNGSTLKKFTSRENGVLVINKPPVLQSKVVVLQKRKGSSHKDVQKEETRTQAYEAFSKRSSSDENDSSRGDRILRERACPSRLENPNSPVIEISDNIGSPSRTMTGHIKEIVRLLLKKRSKLFLKRWMEMTRSSFADKAVEVENSESLLRAKEHLDLFLTEKDKKAEELSTASRSVKEAKNKLNELRALRGAAKNEVDEIESKV
ncbi:hypothetical protein RND71_034594 [Anisodus tanguticus]|uniref:Aminotransferase-like plant mobile domain-containing protein n=1 Tax=Anisodus tanguticus TaxID=243964 RepID=A0AAE1RAW3_9SOLA|nr:hypothetical protein RND71_034594 [Anisodus tanguticus]